MPDYFPTTNSELDTALGAAVTGETIFVQQPSGDPITDLVELTPAVDWTVALGVTLTSNGTRETRVIKRGTGWSEGTATPSGITVTDLTIADGIIQLYGADDFALTDCIIDCNYSGGGRPDSNAFTTFHDDVGGQWSEVVTITRCEARGAQRDAWSLKIRTTGSPADARSGHLICDQIFSGEESDMGLDSNDQIVSGHDLGKTTVKNSFIGCDSSYSTSKCISSGAIKSPITVQNTTITRGGMDASIVSQVIVEDGLDQVFDCYPEEDEVDTPGTLTGSWSDVWIKDNIAKINFGPFTTVGDSVELNRCRFFFTEHEAANHAATTTQVNGLWNIKGDATFRSCLMVGSPRTSSGFSSMIITTGAADSSRRARFYNCTLAHWGIGFDVQASYFAANGVELNNCLVLDVEAKLFQNLDSASVTGKNNFFDVDPATQAATFGTEFNVGLVAREHGSDTSLVDPLNLHDVNGHLLPTGANGDGANAYNMGNFPAFDYRPILPETYKGAGKIFDLGDNSEMETSDARGSTFTADTPGCFEYLIPPLKPRVPLFV